MRAEGIHHVLLEQTLAQAVRLLLFNHGADWYAHPRVPERFSGQQPLAVSALPNAFGSIAFSPFVSHQPSYDLRRSTLDVQASGSSQALKALALITSGPYSTLFWGGAIVVGSVVPLLLGLLGLKRPSVGLTAVVSVLVLVGGFLVKTLIMAAGQV